MPQLGLALAASLPMKDLMQIVKKAEEQGLESFWLTEGIGKDAFSQLAALAMVSQHIRLGTSIVTIYSRSPTLLAMTAASMDDLSGGRFILGLGSGHRAAQQERHGVAFDKPLERMRDYVAIVRRAFSGEQMSYRGSAYQVSGVRLAFSPPSGRVPIYIAVLGLGMARLAGEVGDGIILHLATLEHVKRVKEAVAQGAAAAGRDPSQVDITCFIMCDASANVRRAREEVTRSVANYGAMPYYRNLLRLSGFQEEADGLRRAWERNDAADAFRQVSERMLASLSVSAGPEETRSKVEAYREAGVTQPLLYPVASPEAPVQPAFDALESMAG